VLAYGVLINYSDELGVLWVVCCNSLIQSVQLPLWMGGQEMDP
jgi:hypothetical protein